MRRYNASRHNTRMLLVSSQIPAAIILLAVGLLACFMGYRLFRWLLAIYGFVVGAYLTSLFIDALEPWAAAATVVGGGLAGAALLLLVSAVRGRRWSARSRAGERPRRWRG